MHLPNKVFLAHLISYKQAVESGVKSDITAASDQLGEDLFLLVNRLASKYNYDSFFIFEGGCRDEQVQAAVATLWEKIPRFDTTRPKANPFSYFTQIALNEFRHRWTKSARQAQILDNFKQHQIEEYTVKGQRVAKMEWREER